MGGGCARRSVEVLPSGEQHVRFIRVITDRLAHPTRPEGRRGSHALQGSPLRRARAPSHGMDQEDEFQLLLCLFPSTPRILLNIHDHFEELHERPLDKRAQQAAQKD